MTKLRNYLLINSLFSGVSGLLMIFFNNQLNNIIGIHTGYILPIIGSNLIVFSLFVFIVFRKYYHYKTLVYLISILDWLWVFGSALIVIFKLFNLSSTGYTALGVVALWVSWLAYNQMKHYAHNNS